MLRSSYYPEQYLGMSEKWITKETTTKSASFESRSSSKSLKNTKSPGILPSTSQGSQQPSTPPRILFEVGPDSESVECSPERLPPPQTAPPASPPRPSRDSVEIWETYNSYLCNSRNFNFTFKRVTLTFNLLHYNDKISLTLHDTLSHSLSQNKRNCRQY